MTLVSGIHNFKWWFVAFGKHQLCRCPCKGSHTIDRIFQILAWSFKAAASGVHPTHDHAGKILASESMLGGGQQKNA